MKHPDPKLHLQISLAKSAIRMAAGVAISMSHFVTGGILIILAEVLGVIEELV